MQLLNTPIPPKAIPVSRETLPISDAMHGLQGMTQPNAGMYNADDGGFANPQVNPQIVEAQNFLAQKIRQDMQTAAPQAAAGAMGAVRKEATEQDTAQFRTQSFLNQKMAEELDARGLGQNLMQMNALVQNPDRFKVDSQLATTAAMFDNKAPELGEERVQANQYRV